MLENNETIEHVVSFILMLNKNVYILPFILKIKNGVVRQLYMPGSWCANIRASWLSISGVRLLYESRGFKSHPGELTDMNEATQHAYHSLIYLNSINIIVFD
jgi:hypothetical protein